MDNLLILIDSLLLMFLLAFLYFIIEETISVFQFKIYYRAMHKKYCKLITDRIKINNSNERK